MYYLIVKEVSGRSGSTEEKSSIEFVIIYIDFSEIYMKNVFFSLKR